MKLINSTDHKNAWKRNYGTMHWHRDIFLFSQSVGEGGRGWGRDEGRGMRICGSIIRIYMNFYLI